MGRLRSAENGTIREDHLLREGPPAAFQGVVSAPIGDPQLDRHAARAVAADFASRNTG